MSWRKIESTSRPGNYYYYNTATEETTWTNPHHHHHQAPSPPPPPPPPPKGRSHKHAPRSSHQGHPSHQSRPSHQGHPSHQSHSSHQAHSQRRKEVSESSSNHLDEEMDCEQRWGEDEEVGMDIDLSVEQELELLSEISHTRDNLHLAPSLPGLQSSDRPVYTEMLYLVLDTNVLLSHLNFLVELKDYAIKGVGRPILILPWIVMQELDSLKTRERGGIATRARAAISFLHSCFGAGHPRVKGQTMKEVQTELDNMAISNNDDRILHCCLLYQQKVKDHGGVVVLFSNDIQLCSKAMVNQIHALNRKTLLAELRVLCRNMHQATPTSYVHTPEFSSRVKQELENVLENDDILCESEGIVRDALSTIVTVEMEMAFDSLWSTVVVIKPPWALKDLVHILEKHWIAVFGQVIEGSYRQETLKTLSLHVKTRSSSSLFAMRPMWSDVESFISSSVFLLKSFPKRPNYRDVQSYSLTCLDVLSNKMASSRCLPTTPTMPTSSSLLHNHGNMQTSTTISHERHMTMPPSHGTTPMASALPDPSHPSPSEPRVSLVTLTLDEIDALTRNIPTLPQDQLQWVLKIVLEITKNCLSRTAYSLASDASVDGRREATVFIQVLGNMLENLTVTMYQLLQNHVTAISSLRDFRAALDSFLLTCFQRSCPLSLETLCAAVPLQVDVVSRAAGEYASALDTLRLLAQQYSLPL